MLHLSTTLNVTQFLAENIHSIKFFGISHPKSPQLSSKDKLVFRLANQKKHALLCEENDRRNPKLSSTCSSLSDETLKVLLTGLYFKSNRSIMNHGTDQWWQLLQAAKCTYMHSWSLAGKVMTFLSPFNQWEFSITGEMGKFTFSKDVYSPSIFLYTLPHLVKPSFCTGIQFSRNPIRTFNNQIRMRENKGQSTCILQLDSTPNT